MTGGGAVRKAVVLARGLGTRMRRAEPGAVMDDAQAAAAARGMKAMIPIGRPFLDYALSALADAGCTAACLVIGPEHTDIREYYNRPGATERITIAFAEQREPRGTADAMLAAERFAAGERVLMVNSDNYYPASALAALRAVPGSGLLGFEREALTRRGNIEAARVLKYALLALHADGSLAQIVEKPDAATAAALGTNTLVSMNAWVFGPAIYDACRRVAPSVRGELELQDAVRIAVGEMGERFDVVRVSEGVLDLSSRGDIASVRERLAGVEPRP
ncbi:MAG TPA: sugar phosphate nucleotidyltransferase [Gemmatimonadaceae bacterium]